MILLLSIFNTMGVGQSFECCRAFPEDGEFLLYQEDDSILEEKISHGNYQELSRQIKKVNLLSTVNFHINLVERSQQHFKDLKSYFQLQSHFIDVIELENQQLHLHVVDNNVDSSIFQRYQSSSTFPFSSEVCLLDSEAFRDQRLSEQFKLCFRVLHFLELEQPLHDYEPEFLTRTVIQQLLSIPKSQPFFWDLNQVASFQMLIFHLRYNLENYLPFLNRYLSLRNPTSYTHIRFFYHLIQQHFCQNALSLVSQKYICQISISTVETCLFQKGFLFISTDFLTFLPENSSCECFNYKKQIPQTKILTIHLCPSSSSSRCPKKFIHNQLLTYLPFTIFRVQRVVRTKRGVEIFIAEIKEQIIGAQIKKISNPLSRSKMEGESLMTKSTLLSELKQMQKQLKIKIQQEVGLKKDFDESPVGPLIISFFQNYLEQLREAELENAKQLKNQQGEGGLIPSENLQELYQDSHEISQISFDLVGVSKAEEVKMENRIADYIEELNFQKLQNQFYSVEPFFNLTSLNLSQSWLKKIEHLDCFPNLTELFLYSNEIERVEGLSRNSHLLILSLSRNRITKVENIDHLEHIRELYLTKNKLEARSAEYLSTLKIKSLRALSISFSEDQDASFETISHKLPFKIKTLVINESLNISSRTRNMLIKRLRRTSIFFFQS